MKTSKRISVALLFIVLSFSFISFAAERPLGPEVKKIARENRDVTIQNIDINGIPSYELYKGRGVAKPLAIILHGASGNKDQMVWQALDLARKGFYCVMPDAFAHGERVNDPARLLTEIEVATSNECNTIVEYYLTNKMVNTQKLGLIGFSMGGSSCYHYAAYGKYKPVAIAAFSSTPYWEQLDHSDIPMTMYSVKTGFYGTTMSREEANAYLKDNSPSKNYQRMKDMTVVMLHGENDDVISPIGAKKLYDALKEIGAPNVYLIMTKGGHGGESPEEHNKVIKLFTDAFK